MQYVEDNHYVDELPMTRPQNTYDDTYNASLSDLLGSVCKQHGRVLLGYLGFNYTDKPKVTFDALSAT